MIFTLPVFPLKPLLKLPSRHIYADRMPDNNAHNAPFNFDLICRSLLLFYSEPGPNFHGFTRTYTHLEYLEVCWIAKQTIYESKWELSLCPLWNLDNFCNFHKWVFLYFSALFFSSRLSIPPKPHPSISLQSSHPELPFTLLFHRLTHPLPPPTSPPVEISNFHLPRLCIPPEGRLSSFPISSRSLLALSHSTRSFLFCLSLVRQLTRKRDKPAQTHTPLSFVNTVSSDGRKLPHLPAYLPPTS